MFYNLLEIIRYWDIATFHFINGFAGRWQFLDLAAIFFARYFEFILLAVLLAFLLVNFKKYWRMVAEALIAALFVRFVLVELARLIRFRPRPFVYNNITLLLEHSAFEASFPSGHASFYFALSTIIYGHHKKTGVLFYIGSALIVISRVFAGIHWPLDILGGAVLGVLMGIVLNFLFKKVSNFSPHTSHIH